MSNHQPTHYEILGISPAILREQQDPARFLKQAYHRALLRHHPDKCAISTPTELAFAVLPSAAAAYTVDQISAAFKALASPETRATYDASQSLTGPRAEGEFQTGIETVDLDDLDCDGDGRWF